MSSLASFVLRGTDASHVLTSKPHKDTIQPHSRKVQSQVEQNIHGLLQLLIINPGTR